MPIYEYRCRNCGNEFELLRRLSDSDDDVECEKCGTRKVERLISAFAASGVSNDVGLSGSASACCQASRGFS